MTLMDTGCLWDIKYNVNKFTLYFFIFLKIIIISRLFYGGVILFENSSIIDKWLYPSYLSFQI
jgi:hypothetical protein